MLAHVRAVTRPAHERLEGALGLLDADLNLDRYRDVLGRFYGFWKVWQPQVAALMDDDAFLAPRRRLHLLHADLKALGLSDAALGRLPLCPRVPLTGAPQALGSLYVMEGASLGGRIIQRNVAQRLGEDGRASGTYFSGYGAETGPMWRAFLARLDQAPGANTVAIGRGAAATFERLGWWLTRRSTLS